MEKYTTYQFSQVKSIFENNSTVVTFIHALENVGDITKRILVTRCLFVRSSDISTTEAIFVWRR